MIINFKSLDDELSLLMKRTKKKPDAFYGKANRLAKKLGVEITIEKNQDYGNGYWIETNAMQDERFSTSWEEVYYKLRTIEEEAS